MKNILSFWRLTVWAVFVLGLIWVLAFERDNPQSTRWLIALIVGAAVFFLFTVVVGLRDHRQREHEMDAVDELMGSKEERPFDKRE